MPLYSNWVRYYIVIYSAAKIVILLDWIGTRNKVWNQESGRWIKFLVDVGGNSVENERKDIG